MRISSLILLAAIATSKYNSPMRKTTEKIRAGNACGVRLAALVALALLSSCSYLSFLSTPKNCTEFAAGYSTLEPCWLQNKPEQGLVLHATKNAMGWDKTLEELTNVAIAQFANERYGSEVITTSEVHSSTTVTGSDSVDSRVNHTYTAVITSAGDSITIKTERKDFYYEPGIERAWAWIVEID